MKIALGVFLSVAISATLATAGEDGRNKLASAGAWTAYSLDGFSYLDKGAVHASETACMLETGGGASGLRVVFFPGASVSILQFGSRDWDLKRHKAKLRLDGGGKPVTFKAAQYDDEFIQHVDKTAKGAARYEALDQGGAELTLADNKGKALMVLPMEGYAPMLAKALACARAL
ncbi:hypothetical protein R3X27_09695 [Tropicimonas sp. TH_r6]|uniref:hypothetical protein n=1 Tax=Tropicimonas sp. TH_r6 TaxID=3082085 RepID=UPI00295558D5|nr:hypothetical protein [Tropicimonas sp. TH_r6]MDV7142959.1 hypothetical protein [Tropicimonas sp. TH_r6]